MARRPTSPGVSVIKMGASATQSEYLLLTIELINKQTHHIMTYQVHAQLFQEPGKETYAVFTSVDYPWCRTKLDHQYEEFGIGQFIGKANVGYTTFRAVCNADVEEIGFYVALWMAGVIATDGANSTPYPEGYSHGDPAVS